MGGNRHVALTNDQREGYSISIDLDKKIKSITWLESGDAVEYKETEGGVKLYPTPQPYGQSVVVRIAKIVTE
jgi:hypothetical protein